MFTQILALDIKKYFKWISYTLILGGIQFSDFYPVYSLLLIAFLVYILALGKAFSNNIKFTLILFPAVFVGLELGLFWVSRYADALLSYLSLFSASAGVLISVVIISILTTIDIWNFKIK